ncbi:genomic stop codons [Pristimantis euphronides]
MWMTSWFAQMIKPLVNKFQSPFSNSWPQSTAKPHFKNSNGCPKESSSWAIASLKVHGTSPKIGNKQSTKFLSLLEPSNCRPSWVWSPTADNGSLMPHTSYNYSMKPCLASFTSRTSTDLGNVPTKHWMMLPYLPLKLLKTILCAPALGIRDYTIPFTLFVSESNGHASGVLTQKHCHKPRPIGYYSCKLDPVALAAPTCMRAVLAAKDLLDKVSDIVLGNSLTVAAPHDLKAILDQSQQKHISKQRHIRLQCALLMPSNVTLTRCTTLNPSTLLPLSRGEYTNTNPFEENPAPPDLLPEELRAGPHNCLEVMDTEVAGLPNVFEFELQDAEVTFFTDGSRYVDKYGKFHTGYAVVSLEGDTITAGALPLHLSAQEAELVALTMACQFAKGKRANIYTDSRYAFDVAHDFGQIWAVRGFLTSTGTPIRHSEAIQRLLEALTLPEQVAVIKVKAHGKVNNSIAQGNYLADQVAKQVAVQEMTESAEVYVLTRSKTNQTKEVDTPSTGYELFKTHQAQGTIEEQARWKEEEATLGPDGVWHIRGLLCLPRTMYP